MILVRLLRRDREALHVDARFLKLFSAYSCVLYIAATELQPDITIVLISFGVWMCLSYHSPSNLG